MAYDQKAEEPVNYRDQPASRTLPDEDIIHHRPQWFREALSQPYESRKVKVDGTNIHYLRWGNHDPKRPGLLFVHGNGAHAFWFAFIAPLLTHRYNVASMDLGGMGDSDWREAYTRDTFAHEIGAVAFDAELGPKPVIVGHSFGGFVTLMAGNHYSDKLGGLILCDFTVRSPELHREWFLHDQTRRPTRIYPDFETARARFRLAPLQPCGNGFIVDYIGGLSLREVKAGANEGRRPSSEAGWTWKFDAEMFNGLEMGRDHPEIYKNLKCKKATMFGLESKDYNPESVDYLREIAPDAPVFEVPGAQHHIMLDQPHAFAAAVASLMAQWEADGALS
ncbi:MAG: alpha/beta fold hydrolase [Parvibaculaceae bacterium]